MFNISRSTSKQLSFLGGVGQRPTRSSVKCEGFLTRLRVTIVRIGGKVSLGDLGHLPEADVGGHQLLS